MNVILKSVLVGLFSLAATAQAQASQNVPVEVLNYHSGMNGDECDASLIGAADVFTLEQDATLVLMPCHGGAYQTSYFAYTMDKFQNVSIVTVLTWEGYLSASIWLSEAFFDVNTGILSSFAKSRGIGDCGQYSSHKVSVSEYGYISVKTTQIAYQDCLDEPSEQAMLGEWPIVFAQ